MQSVYEALGGGEQVLRLAHAWHARVLADEEVSHAFSHGYHPDHTERLAAYWSEALGGPASIHRAVRKRDIRSEDAQRQWPPSRDG